MQYILRDGMNSDENVSLHGFAEFICNSWYLWRHPEHTSDQLSAGKSPLLRFFHDVSITHPDDMTDTIISTILHRFNNVPFDLDQTVEYLQAYWRE